VGAMLFLVEILQDSSRFFSPECPTFHELKPRRPERRM